MSAIVELAPAGHMFGYVQVRAMRPDQAKECRTCGVVKVVETGFYQEPRRPGFYYPDCRSCRCTRQRRARDPFEMAQFVANKEAAMALQGGQSVIDRLRARKRRPRSVPPRKIGGTVAGIEGLVPSVWGVTSYTEMSLAILDSYTQYAEAFMAVYHERIGRYLSDDAHVAFNQAVEARARELLADDPPHTQHRPARPARESGRPNDGFDLTIYASCSLTDAMLRATESTIHFAEAFVEVFEARIGIAMDVRSRAKFMGAVAARTRALIAQDPSPPTTVPVKDWQAPAHPGEEN